MIKNKKLLLAAATAAALSGGMTVQAADAPNVLFISVDDMNNWVSPITKNRAITPNMDRIAKMGVTFTHAQAPASYCTPSRAAIMTGKTPYTSGLYADHPIQYNLPDVVTLPEHFMNNGYYTAGTGKVYHHMPGYLVKEGFNEFYFWNNKNKLKGWPIDPWGKGTPHPYGSNKRGNPLPGPVGKAVYTNFDIATLPNEQEAEMSDTIQTKWAANFIKSYDKKEPFFLAYGVYAPHKQNYVPKKYVDMYPLESLKMPVDREGILDDIAPKAKILKRVAGRKKKTFDNVEKGGFQLQVQQHYLASASYADAMVGRVLDALEESGKADNTIIVLWSDNGYHQGEKSLYAKHTMWERTANVPFIWAGPGIPKNVKYDGIVSLNATYPTLIDLTSIKKRNDIDGNSLTSIFAKPEQVQDRIAILSGNYEDYSIASNGYRYIHWADGAEAFYDTSKDPKEEYNQINNPEYKAEIERLRSAMPKNPALAGVPSKKGNLALKLTGEDFKWVKGPKYKEM